MAHTPGTEWTQEEIEEVRTLWKESLSARQIAARMGVTRNSIIGVLNRRIYDDGLREARTKRKKAPGKTLLPKAGERADFSHPRGKKVTPHAAKGLAKQEKLWRENAVFSEKREGSMWRLPRRGYCKFIYGSEETKDFELCGHKAEPGKPYCEAHMDFCYTLDGWLGGRPKSECGKEKA